MVELQATANEKWFSHSARCQRDEAAMTSIRTKFRSSVHWIGFLRIGERDYATAFLSYLYPYALRTRKSAGLMTRKLSVTELQKTAQFFGTSTRRKCRPDRQKSS